MRELRKKQRIPIIYQPSDYSHSQGAPWRNTGCENTGCWLGISREWFQWTQVLASSHTLKSAKFLKISSFLFLRVIFSCSDYLTLVSKLLHILAHSKPCHFLRAVFLGLFEMLPPGLQVLGMSTEKNITLNFWVVPFFGGGGSTPSTDPHLATWQQIPIFSCCIQSWGKSFSPVVKAHCSGPDIYHDR